MSALFESKEIKQKVTEEVAKALKDYKAQKIKLINIQERMEEGVYELYPTIIDSDRESNLKVRQMDRALEGLDEIELAIIKMKFMSRNEQNDAYIMEELNLTKGRYYIKKGGAIDHIAKCLKII